MGTEYRLVDVENKTFLDLGKLNGVEDACCGGTPETFPEFEKNSLEYAATSPDGSNHRTVTNLYVLKLILTFLSSNPSRTLSLMTDQEFIDLIINDYDERNRKLSNELLYKGWREFK